MNVSGIRPYEGFHQNNSIHLDEQQGEAVSAGEISNRDMEKAIRDLEKDRVLQQYQYFVGDDAYIMVKEKEPSEIILRSGENFSL